jgi:hypothetical protein
MDDKGGFPSIHPPSLVRVIDDCRPPSPLSSAPNTPISSRSKSVFLDTRDVAPGTVHALQSSLELSVPRLRRMGDTPFDEPAEELPLSPKEPLQILTPRRGRTASSTSSTRVKLTPSPQKKKRDSTTTTTTCTHNSNSPRRNVLTTGTPSTLRMMALLTNNERENQQTKPSSPIVQESPRSPPMRTTRQFDRTYVPTIVVPGLDLRATLQSVNNQVPDNQTRPRNRSYLPREMDAPHDESPTKRGATTTTSVLQVDNTLLCEGNNGLKHHQMSPHQLVREDFSSCSDDFESIQFLGVEDFDEEEENVSNAAVNMSFNFTSVLSDAGTAMEQFVLGPPKLAKTPEQTAAEWRRRKRLAVLESKALASNKISSNLNHVTSNGVTIEDDDRTAVANNRDRSEIITDILQGSPAKNPPLGQPTGELTVTTGANQTQTTSTVNTLGTDSITAWWLEKEMASHNHKITSSQSVSSSASTPCRVSTVSSSVDDISEITGDSDQKLKKEQTKVTSEKKGVSLTVLMESIEQKPYLVKDQSAEKHETTTVDSLTLHPTETVKSNSSTSQRKEKTSIINGKESIPFSALKNKNKETAKIHAVNGQPIIPSAQKAVVLNFPLSKEHETEIERGIQSPNATKTRNDNAVAMPDCLIIGTKSDNDGPEVRSMLAYPLKVENEKDVVVNATEGEGKKSIPSSCQQLGTEMEMPPLDVSKVSSSHSVDLRVFAEHGDLPTLSTNAPQDESIAVVTAGKIKPNTIPDTCADWKIKANGVSSSSRSVSNAATGLVTVASEVLVLAEPIVNGSKGSLPFTMAAQPLLKRELTSQSVSPTLTNTGNEKKNAINIFNTADKSEQLANVVDKQPSHVAEEQLDPNEYPIIVGHVEEIQADVDSFLIPIVTSSIGLTKSVPIRKGSEEERPCLHSFTFSALGMTKVVDGPCPDILDKIPFVETNRVAPYDVTEVPLSVDYKDDYLDDSEAVNKNQGGGGDREEDERGNYENNTDACEDHTNEEGNDEEVTGDDDYRGDEDEFSEEKDVDKAEVDFDEEEDSVEDKGDDDDNVEDDVDLGNVFRQSHYSTTGARNEDVSVSVSMVSSMAGQSVETANTKASDVTLRRTNETPVMIKSIDDINGIVKGDTMLSLVKTTSESAGTTGCGQVFNAVWRMRTMRRKMAWKEQIRQPPEMEDLPDNTKVFTPIKKRSSLPVDVDDFRVIGGVKNVETLEAHAIEHLQVCIRVVDSMFILGNF